MKFYLYTFFFGLPDPGTKGPVFKNVTALAQQQAATFRFVLTIALPAVIGGVVMCLGQ